MIRAKDNRDMTEIERSDRATIEALRAALKIASAKIGLLEIEEAYQRSLVDRLQRSAVIGPAVQYLLKPQRNRRTA